MPAALNYKICETAKNTNGWYMPVEQVINRVHPKVFKVLFEVIKVLSLTKVEIVSSWRPGIGSSAHREGRALDITHVETAAHGETVAQSADAIDYLPGTQALDTTDTPSTTEPELIKKLREALHRHPDVETIIEPWLGVFGSTGSLEDSYASVRPVPTSPTRMNRKQPSRNARLT